MKIITWNLGYWQFRNFHDEAWDYLRTEIAPDIALLQEVRPPVMKEGEHIVFCERHNGWGTAIYSKKLVLVQVQLCASYPNRVAGAVASLGNGRMLHLASIHAKSSPRVFPELSNIVDEIKTAFVSKSAVVGGDLNSARLAEEVWPGYGHGDFFKHMDESEFVDCCQKINGREIQTFFRNKAVHPFQDDHIFISKNLAEEIQKCDVIDTQVTRRVSDHIPMYIELAI